MRALCFSLDELARIASQCEKTILVWRFNAVKSAGAARTSPFARARPNHLGARRLACPEAPIASGLKGRRLCKPKLASALPPPCKLTIKSQRDNHGRMQLATGILPSFHHSACRLFRHTPRCYTCTTHVTPAIRPTFPPRHRLAQTHPGHTAPCCRPNLDRNWPRP